MCYVPRGGLGDLVCRTSRATTSPSWSLYPQGPHPSTERSRVSNGNKLNLPLVRKHQDQPPSCRAGLASLGFRGQDAWRLPDLSQSKPPASTQTSTVPRGTPSLDATPDPLTQLPPPGSWCRPTALLLAARLPRPGEDGRPQGDDPLTASSVHWAVRIALLGLDSCDIPYSWQGWVGMGRSLWLIFPSKRPRAQKRAAECP